MKAGALFLFFGVIVHPNFFQRSLKPCLGGKVESRYGAEGKISYFGRDDAAQRPGVAVSIKHEGSSLSVMYKRDLMEGGCFDNKCAFDFAELRGEET